MEFKSQGTFNFIRNILIFFLVLSIKISQPKQSKGHFTKDIQDLDVMSEAKSDLKKSLGDVSKTSVTKQIILLAPSSYGKLLIIFSIQEQDSQDDDA